MFVEDSGRNMNFSVVIPLYNKEKHIKRAINSVLKQSCQNFEIIVVDDGSTDTSYIEAMSINDSRVKVFKKNNGGVSSARNYGIMKSSYEYIGFLDADDLWKPLFLESVSRLIYKYPDAGAYATSYEFKKGKNIRRAKINVMLSNGESGIVNYFKGALKDPLISASSVVIKKSVFENIGFFQEDLTRGEDLEMWYRIALNYKIVFLNEVLSVYYMDSNNRATSSPTIYSTSFMSRIENILEEQKKIGNKSIYFEEYMISRVMSKVRYLIKNNRNKEARYILWKYRYTRFNKKKWILYFILSFKPIYFLFETLRK